MVAAAAGLLFKRVAARMVSIDPRARTSMLEIWSGGVPPRSIICTARSPRLREDRREDPDDRRDDPAGKSCGKSGQRLTASSLRRRGRDRYLILNAQDYSDRHNSARRCAWRSSNATPAFTARRRIQHIEEGVPAHRVLLLETLEHRQVRSVKSVPVLRAQVREEIGFGIGGFRLAGENTFQL